MGIFKSLLKSAAAASFKPDFSRSELDNWVDFLAAGGTKEQWENLIKVNKWKFKQDQYEKYQKEVQGVSDEYFYLLPIIQREWSVMNNAKTYTGKQAEEFERMCLSAIGFYIEMRKIDLKNKQSTPKNVPAFNRLIMLYEKQGEFEKAAVICKQACLLDIDKRAALTRMIKKAGRTPTAEEDAIISKT